MKLLVLALRALGDMVLITPIVRALKQRAGFDSLTLVVDAFGAEVFTHNPWVDRLIVLDRVAHRRLPWPSRLAADWTLMRTLRRENYDVAVDLFAGPRSALLTRVSGAPRRYGQDARGRGRGFYYTDRIVVQEPGRHLVEQKLQVIRPLIGASQPELSLEVVLTDQERAWAKAALQERGFVPTRRLVGFFPGGGWGHKQWPIERFAALGDRLMQVGETEILVVGGERDREACRAVAARLRRPPLLFDELTSLRQTMGLIASTDVFVSNDTGPMHVAVALGRPTIALFGPSDVTKYRPWGSHAVVVRHALPCSPCPQQEDTCHLNGRARQECMTLITVDEVVEQVARVLGGAPLEISRGLA
jgi:lipopolysaccharide heptosyltransferase II